MRLGWQARDARSWWFRAVRVAGGLLGSGLALAPAEPGAYHIAAWGAQEGLPQSSVTSILQRRSGYLWLGTFRGLAEFDGVRFRVIDTANLPALPSDRILSLFEDRAGALWCGTEEGKVACWSDRTLQVFSPPNRGTASRYIRAFAQTADGALWMLSAEGQLARLASRQFSIQSTNWPLGGTTATSLCMDTTGQLWVGTDQELAKWRASGFAREWGPQSEDGFGVELLAASRSGGVWVAGHGRLRRFEENGWAQDYGVYPWSKGVLLAMLEDRRGQLWLGTYGSGLFVLDTNGSPHHLSREAGLPGNFIRSLLEDREGNVWAGTEGYGLVQLKSPVFRSYGRQTGLSSDLILTVCEGREGELWIGTNGEGVDRLKDGTVRHYGAESGLSNECVWSICEDRESTVWAGTWGGGLFRREKERFVRLTDGGQCGPVVCGLYEDSQDRLWLAQPRNAPTVTFLRQGHPVSWDLPLSSPELDVRTVMEDESGNIWIGTRGEGLFRRTKDQWTHFGRGEGLSSEVILSLYADSRSVLWVGTQGGLDRLEGTRIMAFTVRDGLPSNLITFITEDSLGNLWCGSGSGVFRVSKALLDRPTSSAGLRCYYYTQADGLPSQECSNGGEPTGCKTRDGRIWFPTVHGLAVVDPKGVPVNDLPPPVVIEEVVVEGRQPETIAVTGGDGQQAREPSLSIPPGRQRFEVHYTGLSFTAPEKVRFKYKLEGLEEHWVEAGTRRVAPYTYVPPGRYRFRVLAANNDGVWNEGGATLVMRLIPQFWQTWWFRWVLGGAVVLLFIAAYELRLAAERRVTRLRLRIARDLHDEVGSNLGSIALLSEVMPRTAQGRGLEEVSEIRRIAVQTIESLRDIVWLLDPAGDSPAELVARMRESAGNLLAGIHFQFRASGESDAPPLPLELRRNLFPAFKELLHNIARHARASRVEISVSLTPSRFELEVNDNGVGFDQNRVHGGNGLKNLRRRAAELHGTLEIRSQPGAGTCVRLGAPLT